MEHQLLANVETRITGTKTKFSHVCSRLVALFPIYRRPYVLKIRSESPTRGTRGLCVPLLQWYAQPQKLDIQSLHRNANL